MPSNRELAEGYLEDAEYSFDEAKRAYERGLYHRVVRRCQECVELSLKAILRLYGTEYPKSHDVSGALMKIADRLPEWLREELDTIVDISTTLAIQRAPSLYGDELRKLPPKKIYHEDDAKKAMEASEKVLKSTKKLLHEWSFMEKG